MPEPGSIDISGKFRTMLYRCTDRAVEVVFNISSRKAGSGERIQRKYKAH